MHQESYYIYKIKLKNKIDCRVYIAVLHLSMVIKEFENTGFARKGEGYSGKNSEENSLV